MKDDLFNFSLKTAVLFGPTLIGREIFLKMI